MSRRTASPAFACVLLVMAGAVTSASAVAARDTAHVSVETPPFSPALHALLRATDDEGRPLVDDELKQYLAELDKDARERLEAVVAEGWITTGAQLANLLAARMPSAKFVLAMEDYCVLCHTDPESQGEHTLFRTARGKYSESHLALDRYVVDEHFRRDLGCAGCHGGDPTEPSDHEFRESWPVKRPARLADRSWIPQFCGDCHADTERMRRFDPQLPTDQLEKYRTSGHGRLVLEKKDRRGAQCVSCHGSHGIERATRTTSPVHPRRVADTCAVCHADPQHMVGFTRDDGSPLPTTQYEEFRRSVHGVALYEKGELSAPTCNDCHGNHASVPAEVASVEQVCRNCHANNGALFDGSGHKRAFEEAGWPECETCHGSHAIETTSDEMLLTGCTSCHAEHARENAECESAARYFYEALQELASTYEDLRHTVRQLERQSIDTEPLENELATFSDSLKTARSTIHAFDREQFEKALEPALASAITLNTMVTVAREELGFRFRGLLAASAFLALTILFLWLRLRETESRRVT